MPADRYAAIDLGTNSFHIIIAEVKNPDTLTIIARDREVIRLGTQIGDELKIISNDEINRAIKILKKFKMLAQKYDAQIFTAATSALREASNRIEFIEQVYKETGIKVNVVDGEYEAELIYKGAEKALELKNQKALCIDVGGGSTEFILTNKAEFVFAKSLKIGAVRLSKKFFPEFFLTDKGIESCRIYVKSILQAELKYGSNVYEIAVGASGTIQSIARTILANKSGTAPRSINGFSFKRDELMEFSDFLLSKKTHEERLQIKNIELKRADILPAGIIILTETFNHFRIEEMKISEFALREGLIFNSI